MLDKKDWKATVADWTHIQAFGTSGKLACLNDQQRQTLLSFLQVAYWLTRWQNPPDLDTLDAFITGIEDSLMTDCDFMFTIRQTGCWIELVVGAVVVSSFKLDAEKCGLLNAGGEGTKVVAPGVIEEDKKTALFSGAMKLVIYCQEAILDAFNAIEIEIEIGKAATLWMETVPGLDLSPAYEVLVACDAFNEMLESVFESTDTPEWREEFSCKIMCWCVENNYTFDASVIDRCRGYLTDMGIAAPDYFYSNFIDVASYKALIDRFSLGMNDEDEDWITLCDDCFEFFGQVTFDAPEDLDYVLEYGTVESIGNPLLGLKAELWTPPGFTNGRRGHILIDLGEDKTLTAVSFDYKYHSFLPGGEIRRRVQYYNESMELIDIWQSTVYAEHYEWHNTIAGLAGVDVRFVRFGLEFNQNEPGSEFYIYGDNIKIFVPA